MFSLPDPHSYGSGNPGATNVLRTGNRAAAALTLIGDGAKGWLAVFLAQQFVPGIEPWLLKQEGDRYYGRGTADNKGQHSVNMAAMQTVIAERGKLGFNVKFMLMFTHS